MKNKLLLITLFVSFFSITPKAVAAYMVKAMPISKLPSLLETGEYALVISVEDSTKHHDGLPTVFPEFEQTQYRSDGSEAPKGTLGYWIRLVKKERGNLVNNEFPFFSRNSAKFFVPSTFLDQNWYLLDPDFVEDRKVNNDIPTLVQSFQKMNFSDFLSLWYNSISYAIAGLSKWKNKEFFYKISEENAGELGKNFQRFLSTSYSQQDKTLFEFQITRDDSEILVTQYRDGEASAPFSVDATVLAAELINATDSNSYGGILHTVKGFRYWFWNNQKFPISQKNQTLNYFTHLTLDSAERLKKAIDRSKQSSHVEYYYKAARPNEVVVKIDDQPERILSKKNSFRLKGTPSIDYNSWAEFWNIVKTLNEGDEAFFEGTVTMLDRLELMEFSAEKYDAFYVKEDGIVELRRAGQEEIFMNIPYTALINANIDTNSPYFKNWSDYASYIIGPGNEKKFTVILTKAEIRNLKKHTNQLKDIVISYSAKDSVMRIHEPKEGGIDLLIRVDFLESVKEQVMIRIDGEERFQLLSLFMVSRVIDASGHKNLEIESKISSQTLQFVKQISRDKTWPTLIKAGQNLLGL